MLKELVCHDWTHSLEETICLCRTSWCWVERWDWYPAWEYHQIDPKGSIMSRRGIMWHLWLCTITSCDSCLLKILVSESAARTRAPRQFIQHTQNRKQIFQSFSTAYKFLCFPVSKTELSYSLLHTYIIHFENFPVCNPQ